LFLTPKQAETDNCDIRRGISAGRRGLQVCVVLVGITSEDVIIDFSLRARTQRATPGNFDNI